MSMQVDLSSPLTAQERKYLEERGRYDEITRVDAMYGVETPAFSDGDGTGPVVHGTTLVDNRDARIAELERQLADLRGDTPDVEDTEEGDVSPYEEWTVKELDAELKRRGLPVKGNQSDKATALYDNDDVTGA